MDAPHLCRRQFQAQRKVRDRRPWITAQLGEDLPVPRGEGHGATI
jgi:hypothetical protein